MFKYSSSSKKKLESSNKDLQRIMNRVIKIYDCTIVYGFRDEELQNKLYKEGRTTLHFPFSKHNSYPSNAIDVVPYPTGWEDVGEMYYLAGIIMGIAAEMDIKLIWGGRWKSFPDLAHFQIVEEVNEE